MLYVTEGVDSEFSTAWVKHQEWADDPVESKEMKRRRLEQVPGVRMSFYIPPRPQRAEEDRGGDEEDDEGRGDG